MSYWYCSTSTCSSSCSSSTCIKRKLIYISYTCYSISCCCYKSYSTYCCCSFNNNFISCSSTMISNTCNNFSRTTICSKNILCRYNCNNRSYIIKYCISFYFNFFICTKYNMLSCIIISPCKYVSCNTFKRTRVMFSITS